MSEQIKIIVSPTGETTVEAEGFQGQSCTEKTKQILESLGPKRGSEEFKPEFWHEGEQKQHVQNG